MDILKHIIAPILPCLMLTSCYEEFTPDVDSEPMLCINSLITAGKPIEVSLTRTRLFTDENNSLKNWYFTNGEFDNAEFESPYRVKDATITIYANGEKVDADYLAQQGDMIRISAHSPQYGSAEASVVVPFAPTISKVRLITDVLSHATYTNEVAMEGYVDFNMVVRMQIDDHDKADNYFKLDYFSYCPSGYDFEMDYFYGPMAALSYGTFDYKSEPIFKEHIGIFEEIIDAGGDGFMFFTDRQFAGKSYTLNIRFNNARYHVRSEEYDEELTECGIKLVVSTVSRSYYNRALYVWQRDEGSLVDLGDIGFAEPMWGYSNVSTGAGVVAAEAQATFDLPLKDFIESTLNFDHP